MPTLAIIASTPLTPPMKGLGACVDNDAAAQLVRRMAAGDRDEALGEFYQAYAGSVMAMLIRILRSQAEAEELSQEIFVELWRRSSDYDPARGSVKTWMARIVRSRAIDKVRARNRRGAGKHVSHEDQVLVADPAQLPDAQTAAGRRRALVQKALAELSAEQREALELSYFAGLSHSEIAKKLDQPLGTIKSRILSAMKVLRAQLAGGDQ